MTAITAATGPLDVSSIVSQLMTVEQQPLTTLQTAASGLQSTVSVFGKIQSLLGTLQDASTSLASVSTWKASAATSSDATTVAATSTSGAAAGTYNVTVSALAQSQSVASAKYASATAAVGAGTLTIQMGTAGNGSFTADGTRAAVNVTIPANATLSDVRDAINSAGAGVSASLVNDGTGARLMLTSTATGAVNGFSVSSGDANLSGLVYDPAGGTGQAMTLSQSAQDASYTIGGIPLTSATNNITNAVDGLTLNLKKVSATPTQVSVGSDTTALRAKVDAFVTAYNAVNTELATDLKYDATTQTAGPLQGNFAARQVQSQLRSVLTKTVGTGSINSLSAAGIQVQSDGSLKVDDTTWNNAAADPAQVQALFATNAVDPTQNGIAGQFSTLLTSTLGVNGSISAALSTLQAKEKANQDDQTKLQAQLTLTQQRLMSQYGALNSSLASMQSISSNLTASLASLTDSSSSSSS